MVLFAWSLGEAMVWPFIADALLIPMAAASRRPAALLAAAIAGMGLGGVGWYLFASAAPDRALSVLEALWLANPDQLEVARSRLVADGALGFLIQPWSGIAFRTWAVAGGSLGLDPLLAIPAFLSARAARMSLSVGIGWALGRTLPKTLRNHFVPIGVVYAAAFLYVWFRMQGLG